MIKLFKQKTYSQKELNAMAFLKKILELENSIFIISLGEYCVGNKEKGVYLFINNRNFTVANHVYYIKDGFRLVFLETLMKMVDMRRDKDLKDIKLKVLKNKENIYSSFYKD